MRATSPRKIGGMAPGANVKLDVLRKAQREDRQPDARRIAGAARGRAPTRDRTRRADRAGSEVPQARPDARSRRARRPAPERGRRRHRGRSDGAAADLGFKTGDVILEVAGKSVATPADVRKALGDAAHRRQAQRADAGEVRRGTRSSRFRSAGAAVNRAGDAWDTANRGVPSASVAPAGGGTRGTGVRPVPTTALRPRHSSPPPGRGRSRGGGVIRRPLFSAVAGRAGTKTSASPQIRR